MTIFQITMNGRTKSMVFGSNMRVQLWVGHHVNIINNPLCGILLSSTNFQFHVRDPGSQIIQNWVSSIIPRSELTSNSITDFIFQWTQRALYFPPPNNYLNWRALKQSRVRWRNSLWLSLRRPPRSDHFPPLPPATLSRKFEEAKSITTTKTKVNIIQFASVIIKATLPLRFCAYPRIE